MSRTGMAKGEGGGGGGHPVGSPLLGGLARGVGWTYLSLALNGASTFFLMGWSIRRIGTAEFGFFSLVLALTALLSVFDYAIGLSVVRSAARVEGDVDPSQKVADLEAVHAAHGAYAILGVAGLAVTAAVSSVAGSFDLGTRHTVATIGLLGIATSVSLGCAALPAVATGCRRFSLRSAATAAGVVVRVVVAVATVGRFGLPGLAAAHLGGICAERLVLAGRLPRVVPWFVGRPHPPERKALRRVANFALPLIVINISGQLFALSDFVVVGSLVGTSAVGLYQVATSVPIYAMGALFTGYNVAFPALAGSADARTQEAATNFLTQVASFVAAAGLVFAALMRSDIVVLLLGDRSDLAEKVLVVFCAICLTNMVVHGAASLLILRGHHMLMTKAVAVELPVNLVLTVLFVIVLGAIGAAIATLVTVLVMDIVVFPLVSRGHFGRPALVTIVRHGLVPAAAGAAVAAMAAQVATLWSGPVPRLVGGSTCAVAVGVAAGLVLLRPAGRATLREAFRKAARPPGGDGVPQVVDI